MSNIGITGSSGSLGKIFLKNYKYRVSCFKGDVRNKESIEKWIKKNNIKSIIHLAAIVPIKKVNNNLKAAYEVNFIGTKNIINVSIKFQLQWLFFASTSHVYKYSNRNISETDEKKPVSYYGKTKLMAENYIIKKLENFSIPYCIGRIFSTANKNQKKDYLVPDLKKKIRYSKSKIYLKNLNHFRDFISMSDISNIIIFLYKKKYKGILNIASGKKIHLKDISLAILKKYKVKNFEFIDNKNPSTLIGNNKKLMKLRKFKLENNIEKLIF
jgi:nucleoside-diphosphate-sugar epimerase